MTAFCSSNNQIGPGNPLPGEKKDRQPYAAGRFYAADAATLAQDIESLLAAAVPPSFPEVRALVSPHAGYVFSGQVAASAFNQIDTSRDYDHVFVIASSHREYFEGASIYYTGDYITPLGRVKVDTLLASRLVRENEVYRFSPRFHDQEHSLEVQLPFLQYMLGSGFTLVPIIIGASKPATCKVIAETLKPYFNRNNLFVISTDFSHYPSYADAVVTDMKTAGAILSNEPENLLKVLRENEKDNIGGLSTSLCGHTSVLTLLYLTAGLPDIQLREVQYRNSGDSPRGEKSRVVGYQAIVACGKLEQAGDGITFSQKDQHDLLSLARQTLEAYLEQGTRPEPDVSGYSAMLSLPMGAFVTLKKNKALRGCIGSFTADGPLYKTVQQMAIAAATQDTRFPKVTAAELKNIHIEISVLTPMREIKDPGEIILGKHGIYIRKGFVSGTFLPQVATETGWSREEFLGHCARDKVGIGWDGWKDASIFVYEAIILEEAF